MPLAIAGAVARRYPWLEYYSPVNEPLTTARISGLYGVWYPHGRAEQIFIQALLNQCRAVVLSMRAITCIRHNVQLMTFSSDPVFDGRQQVPYVESDSVAPLDIYGRSKVEAERRVLDTHPQALSSAPALSSVPGTPTIS